MMLGLVGGMFVDVILVYFNRVSEVVLLINHYFVVESLVGGVLRVSHSCPSARPFNHAVLRLVRQLLLNNLVIIIWPQKLWRLSSIILQLLYNMRRLPWILSQASLRAVSFEHVRTFVKVVEMSLLVTVIAHYFN